MSLVVQQDAISTLRVLRRKWLAVPAAVLALALLLWVGFAGGSGSSAQGGGQFYAVVPLAMDVRVVKDGELQAVNNIDIVSEVEGQTTIQQLVKEGATVTKGEVLLVLDSAAIRQRLDDATMELQRAEADLTTAREMKEIQESQNAANLEGAMVSLTLAQLDLQQYQEGTYPQQLANLQTDLEMAQITLRNREDDLAQTQSLFSKGFVTGADVKKSQLELTTARNGLAKAQTALRVLTEYTHAMDLTSRKNNLAQAEQRLVRVKRENTSNMAQKLADLKTKEQALAMARRKVEKLQQQLEACTVHAPAEGMVVYATSGDRNAQNPIQEGAQVRERQMLLRLPDTSKMKAVVRIQEAQVSRLRIGQRGTVRIVGVPQPLSATLTRISVLADSSQRWWNPDVKEYPVDLTLDQTPEGLKPGMGAVGEIYIERLENVVAVPLAALYSAGSDRYVFVRQDGEVSPRKVTVGSSNETYVQITEGLQQSEEVLLLGVGQGRELLEKAGIKPTPTSKPA